MDEATLVTELRRIAEACDQTEFIHVAGILHAIIAAVLMHEQQALLRYMRPWLIDAQRRSAGDVGRN